MKILKMRSIEMKWKRFQRPYLFNYSNLIKSNTEDQLLIVISSVFFTNLDDNNLRIPDLTRLDINEIKRCGVFSTEEQAAGYRRRGKSPSGVIDGEYNGEYRGNDEYND